MRKYSFAILFSESVSRCYKTFVVLQRMLGYDKSRPVSLIDILTRCFSDVNPKIVKLELGMQPFNMADDVMMMMIMTTTVTRMTKIMTKS